jgi:serine/threonine protein kinase
MAWYRISNQAKELVNRMLEKLPKTRLTIWEALAADWLKDYNLSNNDN